MHRKSKTVSNLTHGLFSFKGELTLWLGLFQLIFKVKAGFGLTGFLIKHPLFLEDFMRRQFFSGSVQALMCFLSPFLQPPDFTA